MKNKEVLTQSTQRNAKNEVKHFSETHTELDEMIDEFVTALHSISVGITAIKTASLELRDFDAYPDKLAESISKRLKNIPVKFNEVMSLALKVNEQIDVIQKIIESGSLMKKLDYIESKNTVDRTSVLVEGDIDDINSHLSEGSPYKEAYNYMMQVTTEYVKLVRKLNIAVTTYNKLHKTNLAEAKRIRTVSKGVNYKTGEGMKLGPWHSFEEHKIYSNALIAEDYDDEIDEDEE